MIADEKLFSPQSKFISLLLGVNGFKEMKSGH